MIAHRTADRTDRLGFRRGRSLRLPPRIHPIRRGRLVGSSSVAVPRHRERRAVVPGHLQRQVRIGARS